MKDIEKWLIKTVHYKRYLMTPMGGKFQEAQANQAIHQVTSWIQWTFQETKRRQMVEGEIEKFVKRVIIRKVGLLNGWCDAVCEELKASTVINYLNAVAKFAEWYTSFNPAHLRHLRGADYLGFLGVVKMMRKELVKARKREDSPKTMQDEVFKLHLPEDGLPALQAEVLKDYERLKTELEEKNGRVRKGIYNEFIQLVIAAFYVLMPQGRVGGFESLTMEHVDDLISQGHTMSTTFKTRAKYGYQPIIATELAIEILGVYVDVLRPVAVRNFEPTKEQATVSDNLWLTFQGKPDKVGRRVTDFFQRTMKLHVTTTAIRALVETEVRNAQLRGDIDAEGREAVHNVNGHTGAVVKDFYLRHDRTADARKAKESFAQMNIRNLERQRDAYAAEAGKKRSQEVDIAEETTSKIEEVDCEGTEYSEFDMQMRRSVELLSIMKRELSPKTGMEWPIADKLEPSHWGVDHPEKRPGAKKVQWTDEELKHIAEWCTKAQEEHPTWRKTIVAKCREALWKDPNAMKIFHVNHVLDSGRLNTGYKKAIAEGWFPENWKTE
jgi:hypothetical protein